MGERTKSLAGRFPLDVAVIDAIETLPLPSDGAWDGKLTVVSANEEGRVSWSVSAKVDARDQNSNVVSFFLKCVDHVDGKAQLEGEYAGMREMHKLVPNFVVKPYTWGQLKNAERPTYFLLLDFKPLNKSPLQRGNNGFVLADPVKLSARLIEMHLKSESPNGQFGFPITTYDGARSQVVDWDPSWTSFFTKLLTEAYRHDTNTNGIWPELDEVFKKVVTQLIPRLIGVMESDGRSIKPSLVHGNLWEGNIGVDQENDDPWIFDASCFYGHHEFEVAIWRAQRHDMREEVYRAQYFKNIGQSDPETEYVDRNVLYSVKTNFMHSACVPRGNSRQHAYNDLTYLLDKYCQ